MFQIRQQKRIGYEAQAILDERLINNQLYYLIKWRGLSSKFSTWQPISGLEKITDLLKVWVIQKKAKINKIQQVPKTKSKTNQQVQVGKNQIVLIDLVNDEETSDKYCFQGNNQLRRFGPKQVNPKQLNKYSNGRERVRVIPIADPSKISKICKLFSFKGIKCAEVEYECGRHLNMKQEDLKRTNPMLLMEYYENEGIPI